MSSRVLLLVFCLCGNFFFVDRQIGMLCVVMLDLGVVWFFLILLRNSHSHSSRNSHNLRVIQLPGLQTADTKNFPSGWIRVCMEKLAHLDPIRITKKQFQKTRDRETTKKIVTQYISRDLHKKNKLVHVQKHVTKIAARTRQMDRSIPLPQ